MTSSTGAAMAATEAGGVARAQQDAASGGSSAAAPAAAAQPAAGRPVADTAATAAREPWLRAAGFAVLVGLVALTWAVYIRPIAHFDVEVFLRAGAAVDDGRDPYPPAGTAEVYSGFAFVYPYLVALPFVPLAALGAWGADVFIAVSVAAVLLGAYLVGARRWRTFALVLAASCTVTGLQMGTVNGLLFLGLAALWRYRDTPAAAGAVTAVLIYSKLFLAPVWLFLLLTRRWAASGVAAAALAVLFGVGELASPVGTRTYAQMLSVLAREEAPDGLSLTGLGMNVGLGLEAAGWLARAVGLCLVVACWVHVRRQQHAVGEDRGDSRLLFAGTVAAALVASPIVWSHYLLLLVAPLLVVAHADNGLGWSDTTRSGRQNGRSLPAAESTRSDTALAAFAVGSWLVVTPHLSAAADRLGAGAVLALLAGPVLLPAAGRLVRRCGGRARARSAGALACAAVAAVTGVCLGLRAAAGSPTASARVVGAYCALVGVFALLGWARAHTGGGAPTPHPGGSPA